MKQLRNPRGNPLEIRGLSQVRSWLKRLKSRPAATRQSSKRSSRLRPALRCLPLLQTYVSISSCSLSDLLALGFTLQKPTDSHTTYGIESYLQYGAQC